MALHTAPRVLALIRCKTRVNRDSALFEMGTSVLLCQRALGGDSVLEESLEYFVGPECSSTPPEAASLPACVTATCLCVCVLSACGNQLLTHYK